MSRSLTSAKFATKLARYSAELNFVLKNGLDWATRIRLTTSTARFHLSNALKLEPQLEPAIQAKLRISENCNTEIVLRPLAGDLFILFEVLMDKCYQIPYKMLDPKKVRVILDCGANIGIASLFFASRYPNASVYSIEPSPENFELLMNNTKLIPNIVPIHGAIVGTARKSTRLTVGRAAWGNAITKQCEGVEVPAFTVDQICKDHQLSQVDLLKMDVEGAEKEIFANGGFLRQVGFVIIELHDDYNIEQFSKHLARWSFAVRTPNDVPDLKMLIAEPKL
jgi:FkbM family methyltransferase